MTAAKMAETAYGAQSAAARTPRGTEYAVFSQITRRMKAAADKGPAEFPALAEALHENHRLWTTLAVNLADEDNQLPRDLRARLFYLAEFTFQHTAKVLAREADARPLIEINAAIMRGLLGQAPEAAQTGALREAAG
jgi:flagellar protein FlaF